MRAFAMCDKRNDSFKARTLLEHYKLRVTLPRVKILLSIRALATENLSVSDIEQDLLRQNIPITRASIHNMLKELTKRELLQRNQDPSFSLFTPTECFSAIFEDF